MGIDFNGSSFVVSHDDTWDLHRKGELDQARHTDKIRDAIKKNLRDIIADESIIMNDGKKTIRVPVKSLDEFHFANDWEGKNRVGTGDANTQSGNGTTQKGTIIAQRPKSGQGQGKDKGEAGSEAGDEYYEAEIDFEEIAAMIFEDLGLPNLDPKKQPDMSAESFNFNDIRKKGIMSNVDRKRTIKEVMMRNALAGRGANMKGITPEDLRYKTWVVTQQPKANAVILAMMDTSGSMGEFEKYISRSFYFWMLRFLRTKYTNVQIVFISHDVRAHEVDEKDFFTRTEGGGTMVSSAYELALKIAHERYNPDDWNIYPFHFSDGDNLSSDNSRSMELMLELVKISSATGYGEIDGSSEGSPAYQRSGNLRSLFQQIKDPKFTSVLVKERADVYPALQKFFKLREEGSK